jgi:hypothetical protein
MAPVPGLHRRPSIRRLSRCRSQRSSQRHRTTPLRYARRIDHRDCVVRTFVAEACEGNRCWTAPSPEEHAPDRRRSEWKEQSRHGEEAWHGWEIQGIQRRRSRLRRCHHGPVLQRTFSSSSSSKLCTDEPVQFNIDTGAFGSDSQGPFSGYGGHDHGAFSYDGSAGAYGTMGGKSALYGADGGSAESEFLEISP